MLGSLAAGRDSDRRSDRLSETRTGRRPQSGVRCARRVRLVRRLEAATVFPDAGTGDEGAGTGESGVGTGENGAATVGAGSKATSSTRGGLLSPFRLKRRYSEFFSIIRGLRCARTATSDSSIGAGQD